MLIFILPVCIHAFILKCFQIDEVKNIGGLPCLEKVMLSSNPLSIIPDYRTKVLAQFGDRASEVSPGLPSSPPFSLGWAVLQMLWKPEEFLCALEKVFREWNLIMVIQQRSQI